jgi:peptidoglycan/LPS O-acetylase OafA/YrhL
MSKQPSYRPDIDGLRAIAVLLVIGFHAFPNLVPGGYVGVDVFFVISGFLITGLLLQDLENKDFSFSRFYARRIRRIFPALVVVLVVCFAAGWVILPPLDFRSLGINTFGGAAFSSNLVLLGEAGYFDFVAAQKPLLHLWSLGIEEQFYIVWPVLLLLTFSRRLSIVVLASVLLIVSFVWNVRIVGSAADFYLPFTRAWELMIGGIIAALAQHTGTPDRAVGRIRSALNAMPQRVRDLSSHHDQRALLGIVFILAAVIAGRSNSGAFPGWWALLPTLGTALIITSSGAWLNRNILSNATVVLIGLVSYPLYLWHWPLLSFASIAVPELSWPLRIALVAAAVVLAWLTYRWIEQPIRRGRQFPLKIALLCAAMALIGSAGLAVFYWQGVPYRVPAQIRDMVDIHLTPQFEHAEWRRDKCFFDVGPSRFEPDCVERDKRPLLFLWGDSTATSLYPGLKGLQASVDFGLAQFTRGGCPPLPTFGVKELPDCAKSNDLVFAALADAHPDIVLLHSTWDYYNAVPILRDLIERLRALKIPRIIVMGPSAGWIGGLPGTAYRYYMLHFYLHDPARQLIPVRSNFGVNEALYANEQRFRQEVTPWGVEYISAWDALCNGDECLTRTGEGDKALVAFDYVHLTVPGANYLARAVAPCLFPDRALPTPEGVDQSRVCPPPGGPTGSFPLPKPR